MVLWHQLQALCILLYSVAVWRSAEVLQSWSNSCILLWAHHPQCLPFPASHVLGIRATPLVLRSPLSCHLIIVQLSFVYVPPMQQVCAGCIWFMSAEALYVYVYVYRECLLTCRALHQAAWMMMRLLPDFLWTKAWRSWYPSHTPKTLVGLLTPLRLPTQGSVHKFTTHHVNLCTGTQMLCCPKSRYLSLYSSDLLLQKLLTMSRLWLRRGCG